MTPDRKRELEQWDREPAQATVIREGLGSLFSDPQATADERTLADRASKSLTGTDPLWDGFRGMMLRKSPAFFATELLRGPPQPPYNGRFLAGDHHQQWDRLVTSHKRLCVNAPRDHGKTYYFTFAYPIWQAATHPNEKGFIFSATATQAERILEDIRVEVENNPELQWLVPSKKDRGWSTRQLRFSNGHTIYARGFGTRVRGAHPRWIVVDDGLNDESAYSEMVRNKQIDYFYTAITNMVVPEGQIIVVGTPFAVNDLYGELANNDEYKFARFPAVSKDGEVLWPQRYSPSLLDKRRREIGAIRFSREFLCVPASDEMSLFPVSLFKGDPVELPTVRLGQPLSYWNEVADLSIYMGVDLAISSNIGADYTVIWTMGVDDRGNRWILDIQRLHGASFQDQLSEIIRVGRRYDPARVYVEANQMQQVFGNELIRKTDLPVAKFTTTAAKSKLDKGVPSLRVLLENQKFRIPRGDSRSVELTDRWIDEMHNITFRDGKVESVGEHDDLVMACWICDQAIRAGKFQFSFGTEFTAEELTKFPESDASESKRLFDAELMGAPLPHTLIRGF